MADLYDEMRVAVLMGEEEDAATLAERVLAENLDPLESMNEGFLKGIREAGELYQEGEYFLPELVCSADAMKTALEILNPAIRQMDEGSVSKGLVVLATVQGDIHDIGKTIVGAMLTAGGYEILDLGSDVASAEIVQTVREQKPRILGMSALLTTTMEQQRTVISLLKNEGLRDGLKVIVGGAPASQEWADKIHADGYADNAMDAVKLVDGLLA